MIFHPDQGQARRVSTALRHSRADSEIRRVYRPVKPGQRSGAGGPDSPENAEFPLRNPGVTRSHLCFYR